jgi:glycosyltransferase involved in cell wall biosynthesis
MEIGLGMVKTLRVGFLSSHNYFDRNAFSGTLYYMYRALSRQKIDLVPLGKAYPPSKLQCITRYFQPNGFSPLDAQNESYFEDCQKFGRLANQQLQEDAYDVIFAPVGALELFSTTVRVPAVYLSDATFKLYQQFYPLHLTEAQRKAAAEAEIHALAIAQRVIYSSQWAADSAINDYHIAPDKIRVINFGANLDQVPQPEVVVTRPDSPECRLLFAGRSWERKGGSIAFDCLMALLRMGMDAELTIFGCVPLDYAKHPKVNIIPFLDKNKARDRKKIAQLYLHSHFLLFPSRADCSPISLCEASAFGLPVLASAVGGIPSIVREGVNGFLFPLAATGEDYARAIAEIFTDKARYQKLIIQARQEYENRLNWDVWAKATYSVLLEAVNSPGSCHQGLHQTKSL